MFFIFCHYLVLFLLIKSYFCWINCTKCYPSNWGIIFLENKLWVLQPLMFDYLCVLSLFSYNYHKHVTWFSFQMQLMTSQRCEIIKKLFSIQNAINLKEKSFNYCTVFTLISGTWTITTFSKIFAEDYVDTYLSNNFCYILVIIICLTQGDLLFCGGFKNMLSSLQFYTSTPSLCMPQMVTFTK